ncbi:STAS domain-containing protein, partial [Planctomycetota bacterium]
QGADDVLMVKLGLGQGRQELFDSIDPGDAEILRLSEQLSQENIAPDLTLDFSSVGLISSKALGRLITLDKKVKKRGGKLRLCKVRPETYKLFAITRLNRLFDIETA